MKPIELNDEWSQLMETYRLDHQDPRNKLCHRIGIPLIAGSLAAGATVIGLPLAAVMFTTGWAFQFVGHAFEGKKPSFVGDKRQLLVGAMWWAQEMGLDLVRAQKTTADA